MQGLLEKAVVKVLMRYSPPFFTEESARRMADEIASEYYSAEAEANLPND